MLFSRLCVTAVGVVLLVSILASTARTQAASGHVDRMTHCAHPQVLIAGGTLQSDGTAATPGAELYNIASGTFSSAEAMILPRTGHTATTLSDGRVLLSGGYGPGFTPTATAEIFDPSTGQFSATGSMSVARVRHSATLLNDGTVLIAGGSPDGLSELSSAEIYDPKTASFKPTGAMAFARENQGAALLKYGTVLIAGGDNNAMFLKSAELYRPGMHHFVKLPDLAAATSPGNGGGVPSTLLQNGTVVIVGQSDPAACCPSGVNKGAEIYHPWFRTFVKTKNDMQEIRTGPTATLLRDGTVLLAGGYPLEGELNDAEVYDPKAETFTLTNNVMSSERGGHTATLLPDGTVLVAGGDAQGTQPGQIRDEFPQASADLYDPVTRLFTPTSGEMAVARAGHTANLVCSP